MTKSDARTETICIHCGDPCPPGSPEDEGQAFCCPGCRTVYALLHDNDLQEYYQLEDRPGLKPKPAEHLERFAYLDDHDIVAKLLDFSDGRVSRVTLSIPQIHCSSCIWLLENLFVLDAGITASRVDFPRREVSVTFAEDKLNLRKLVEMLVSIGYEPDIRLADLESTPRDRSARKLYARLAVAGFCFGNVMMLSFPEYLGLDSILQAKLGNAFNYLNAALSLPVIFFSSADFFRSAFTGVRQKFINMDLPISLGILVLFIRSLYDILILGQAGYMDSLCGLVFLLLIGRLYQQKTYASLSFEKNFKSYLPIAVLRKQETGEVTVPVNNLEPGDRIIVRNRELIPADGVLINGDGQIDYSFVTGEAEPVEAASGQRLYAGGRQMGQSLEIEVVKLPSQSYLMQLWTQMASGDEDTPHLENLANQASRWFTPAVLVVAAFAGLFWMAVDSTRALNAATAVLIVACPCALALSSPFTLGTVLRFMGRRNLYLKDSGAVERLAGITSAVFDKTGTLTRAGETTPIWTGEPLTPERERLVFSVVRHSTHPLSVMLARNLLEHESRTVTDFIEEPGKGLSATVGDAVVRVGAASWVGAENTSGQNADGETRVYVSIAGETIGYFRLANHLRPGLANVLASLGKRMKLGLISGDHDAERSRLTELFGPDADLRFRQSPHDKLDHVRSLRKSGEKVLMIGDGLNDAGALRAATVGIAIAEDASAFSPACDGILQAESFSLLPDFVALARSSVTIIKASFVLSVLYNVVGLAFAVQGLLSPLVAAILMPASSVTVVLFATVASAVAARRHGVIQSWK